MEQRWITFVLLLALLALVAMTWWAPAQEASTCEGIGVVRGEIERAGGEWIETTHDQATALRWAFRTSPTTADRFPFGEGAAVAKKNGLELVFFIDGDLACDPTPLPDELWQMLQSAEFAHPAHAPGRT